MMKVIIFGRGMANRSVRPKAPIIIKVIILVAYALFFFSQSTKSRGKRCRYELGGHARVSDIVPHCVIDHHFQSTTSRHTQSPLSSPLSDIPSHLSHTPSPSIQTPQRKIQVLLKEEAEYKWPPEPPLALEAILHLQNMTDFVISEAETFSSLAQSGPKKKITCLLGPREGPRPNCPPSRS